MYIEAYKRKRHYTTLSYSIRQRIILHKTTVDDTSVHYTTEY